MNIRLYRESDFPAIESIYAGSKLDELAGEERRFDLLPLAEDHRRLAEFRESTVYVCDDEGVVGYCAIFGTEIRGLFVDPAARGKGVGKSMLAFLLAKTKGPWSLHVVKSNSAAIALYEKSGFEIVEEFETSYNGVPVIACKMAHPSTKE